jgi:curved DNA-binding protein
MNDGRDLYAALGVPKTASADEIRSTYRRLARELHPDVNPSPSAAERFKEASAAYDVLSDPQKRALYDEFGAAALHSGFDPDKARAHQEWMRRQARDNVGGGSFGVDFGDLADLFGFGRGDWHRAEYAAMRGEDVLARVEIDLADALRGIDVEVRVPILAACTACRGRAAVSCATCGGVGQLRSEETVTARIPAGADDGSRLRVRGRGGASPGGPRGDLIIETRVRPHRHFKRNGLDLILLLPVRLDEAYNGATVRVPTPDGPVSLKVPPGSPSGARLRLKGRGVQRGDQRGDLYVELDVRLPPAGDSAFGEAAERAASLYDGPIRRDIEL